MSDDIVWNVVGSNSIKGKPAMLAYCDKMLVVMANSTLINTSHIVSEDLIAVQGYCNYMNENDTPGRVEYCDVYRFNEGKLHEITSYCIEIKNELISN